MDTNDLVLQTVTGALAAKKSWAKTHVGQFVWKRLVFPFFFFSLCWKHIRGQSEEELEAF